MRKKRKTKGRSTLDDIFKYPIRCVKCSYRGMMATKKADMKRLACHQCGSKLVYLPNPERSKGNGQKTKRSKRGV